MIELEKTFLAKYVPEGVKRKHEIVDIYLPKAREHPVLRLRKKDDEYLLVKKKHVDKDVSEQKEETINLSEEEYNELAKLEGKRLRKIRYTYYVNGRVADIDVFKDKLEGLILVDFEFDNKEDKENFTTPDFCLKDVTDEKFIAGGMLCGKSYEDIRPELEKHGYEVEE